MATGVITNTILDPSGTAVASVVITARLMPGTSGFRTGTFSEITQIESTTTDVNGAWSLTLEKNTDILPGDSYYQITEDIPVASGGQKVHSVQVGAGSNTLYASLVSTPPGTSSPDYITQSTGDARYMAFGQFSIGSIQPVGTATITGTATTAAASNHQHPLSPAVVGSALSLSSGVLSVSGAQNSNALSGNTFVMRDTNTATATIQVGQIRYSTASNRAFLFPARQSWLGLFPEAAVIATSETAGAGGGYAALATPGPAVTLMTGTQVWVVVGFAGSNASLNGSGFMSVAVSGATTIAAADANAYQETSFTAGNGTAGSFGSLLTGLTPGLNTFTALYKATTGTETFLNRNLLVIPLP